MRNVAEMKILSKSLRYEEHKYSAAKAILFRSDTQTFLFIKYIKIKRKKEAPDTFSRFHI